MSFKFFIETVYSLFYKSKQLSFSILCVGLIEIRICLLKGLVT